MIKNYILEIDYTLNGEKFALVQGDKNISCSAKNDEGHFELSINAAKAVSIERFALSFPYCFGENDLFFANGFQSWTDTKEWKKSEKITRMGCIAKGPIGKALGLRYVGDYTFVNYPKQSGIFHSHGYTYIRKGDNFELYGSLNDRLGYTVFVGDMNANKITIQKDLQGKQIVGSLKVLDIVKYVGEYEKVFDKYFNALEVKPRVDKKLKGYTTWYNYYQNLKEKDVLRDLEAITNASKDINIFQIDDGFQNYVGEWLNINSNKMPSGMKAMADAIHSKGIMAGLWLAPFGVQKNAPMVKQHPDWFVKSPENGKPICVGGNWGGFFALDIYNEEVRTYLRKVFDTVFNEWGYDMVKLDFLYAAAVLPRNGKTRSQIMYEAMDFLRELVGDKLLLGCGVQMLPCFGVADYMRIGADMSLGWKDNAIRRSSHREDVSTTYAIDNSFYRRHLNGRAFLCDPDVFLLRDYNIHFTFEQRVLLGKIIKLFGSIIFTSDDVSSYSQKQLDALKDTLTEAKTSVQKVSQENDICTIDYTFNGEKKTLKFNHKNGIEL